MTGALLHNMSVPPRYRLSVRRPPLGGVSFSIGPAKYWREFNPASPPSREALEAALARFDVPDRVGVFLAGDGPGQSTALSFLAAAAILSRSSGPLYLPWRPNTSPLASSNLPTPRSPGSSTGRVRSR